MVLLVAVYIPPHPVLQALLEEQKPVTSSELDDQGATRDAQFLIKPEYELLLEMLQPTDDMDRHVIQLSHGTSRHPARA